MKQLIITLAGLGGTGTSKLGLYLHDHYGFEFASTGNFARQIAKQAGYQSIESFVQTNPKYEDYDREIDNLSVKVAQNNNGLLVIESRIAFEILRRASVVAFNVCLVCKDNERIRRIADRDKGVKNDVRWSTYLREKEDDRRYLGQYGISSLKFPEKHNFDLVLDTTYTPTKKLAEIILQRSGINA